MSNENTGMVKERKAKWLEGADRLYWNGSMKAKEKGYRWEAVGIRVGRKSRREGWVATANRNYSDAWLPMESVVLATWSWKVEGCCSLQFWTTCSQGNRIHPRHMVADHEDVGVCQEASVQGRLYWLACSRQCPHPSPQNLTWAAAFPWYSSQCHQPHFERREIITGCNCTDLSPGTGHDTLVHGNAKKSKAEAAIEFE